MTEAYRYTASQVLPELRSGQLSVEDYAKSLLSRIKERDRAVQAWAYLDPEFVLKEARRLDSIPSEKRGPLHGLPIGVKDVFLTKDMPTQYNSLIYKTSQQAFVDAAAVITLRAAGAFIFGKTATTEFAATTEGGSCMNPHDSKRTPGGSSSGSGAAVGDFQIPIALGTQTAGSMVRPGSYNGIYALKPTWGAISREGAVQWSMTCDTVGVFARSVEDIELLGNVFRLVDDTPVPSQPFPLKGAKIAFCKSPVWSKVGPGTKNTFKKAEQLLKSHGANIEDLDLPEEFSKIHDWHSKVISGEGRTSFLGNYLLAKDKLHATIIDHVENKGVISRKDQLDAYDGCARLRPVWDEIARKYDAVITPSVPDEAPIGLEFTGEAAFCSMWTILQVPSLNIPGFAGENGLPIGLTLVGPRYHDMHVLHTGKAIGKVFESEGGFRRSNV